MIYKAPKVRALRKVPAYVLATTAYCKERWQSLHLASRWNLLRSSHTATKAAATTAEMQHGILLLAKWLSLVIRTSLSLASACVLWLWCAKSDGFLGLSYIHSGKVSLLQHKKPRPKKCMAVKFLGSVFYCWPGFARWQLEYFISNEASEHAQLWFTIQLKYGNHTFSKTSFWSSKFLDAMKLVLMASQLQNSWKLQHSQCGVWCGCRN